MTKRKASYIEPMEQLRLDFEFYQDASTSELISDEDRNHASNKNPPNKLFSPIVEKDYLAWVDRRIAQGIKLREIDKHLPTKYGFDIQDKLHYW